MNEQPTTVEYRPIPGFFGYEVGRDGSVYSHKRTTNRGWFLTQHDDGDGYMVVRTSCGGLTATLRVHRAVMLAFVGPIPEGHQIDHINGNSKDNRLENLRYVTAEGNARNRDRLGRTVRKLRWEDVVDIRLIAHKSSKSAIARKYGLSRATVTRILQWTTWKRRPECCQ